MKEVLHINADAEVCTLLCGLPWHLESSVDSIWFPDYTTTSRGQNYTWCPRCVERVPMAQLAATEL